MNPSTQERIDAFRKSIPSGNGNNTPVGDSENEGFGFVTADVDDGYRPFPIQVIPPPARQYIEEVAAALGCDPAYVALPLLAGIAGAIGNTRSIQLKSTWQEPAVIWAAVVGLSGTVKSPAFDAAMRFTRARQRKLMKAHAAAMKQFKAGKKEWKAKGGEGDEPEPPPPLEHLHCHDITVEALADRLASTPRGTIVAMDELAGWLNSFNAYKKSGGDVEHYLSMHRAGGLKVDRKTGDKTTIYVPAAAVSVTGTIQPDALGRALTDQFFGNGLAARILVAMPPAEPKTWNNRVISEDVIDAMATLFDTLLSRQGDRDADGDPIPKPLPLAPPARETFISFYNKHNQQQAELEDPRLASMWAKIEGYAARLALVLQLIADPLASYVDDEFMEGGIKLARWFGDEARRVYATLRRHDTDTEQSELIGLIELRGGTISERELAHASRRYRLPGAAAAALQSLVTAGLGKWEFPPPGEVGGRPRRIFRLYTAGANGATR